MNTTFEEAIKCPRCERPGQAVGSNKVRKPGRGTVEIFKIQCTTKLCKWFETIYLVQINEDGSIPEAHGQNLQKQFPRLSPESESRIIDALKAQQQAEVCSDNEIRNPYA